MYSCSSSDVALSDPMSTPRVVGVVEFPEWSDSERATGATPVTDGSSPFSLVRGSSVLGFVEARPAAHKDGQLIAAKLSGLFEPSTRRRWWPLGRKSGRDRYEVCYANRLGKGSFGYVYEAAWRRNGRLPAHLAKLREGELDPAQLKWFEQLNERRDDDSPFADKQSKQKFQSQQEVAMLTLCQGPRILLFVETFDAKDLLRETMSHIITNRCYGHAADRVKMFERSPSVVAQLARKWTAQLVRAVAHVHAKGVLHRDVKPTNVLCTSLGLDSDVMLGDFGLATVGEMSRSAGSWGFWDPTAFTGTMTRASDVWALGSTALRLCGANLCVAKSCGQEVQLSKEELHEKLLAGWARTKVYQSAVCEQAGLTASLLLCFQLEAPARHSCSDLQALLPELSSEICGPIWS